MLSVSRATVSREWSGQHDVGGLEVAVDDAVAMRVIECLHDLDRVV
jgi:hypothetical protein